MWFGCLVHVRVAIRPRMWPLLMIQYLFSFASNAIPPHYCIDILHLSRTYVILSEAILPHSCGLMGHHTCPKSALLLRNVPRLSFSPERVMLTPNLLSFPLLTTAHLLSASQA